MCGITGAIGLNGKSVAVEVVQPMVQALRHRGPDALQVSRLSDSVVFGHTRLAIFDLHERANQPMHYQQKWITYNGEVFNFLELAALVSDTEEPLETSGDTEIVLRMMAKKGIAGLSLLDGFFAFAFFDGISVTLVRDRFGQKPIYYAVLDDILYFASEIKALCTVLPGLTPRQSVVEYVDRYRFSPSLSPFDEIEMLPPGSYLQVEPGNGEIQIDSWYRVTESIKLLQPTEQRQKNHNALIVRTKELFLTAVEKRLKADVPVGILCSGGIDSSLIAWAAAQQQPVTLFHVEVVEKSERRYAELLAAQLGCELQVLSWGKEEFDDHYREALLAFEYPLVHPNNTALLAIARFAAEKGIKVLLGGEGADELFGGYVHQQRYFWIQKIARLLGAPIARFLSGSQTPAARWKQHTRGVDRNAEREVQSMVDSLSGLYQDYSDGNYLGFLLSDFLTYLQPLLLRGDKLTMAAGVELRSPFLDRDLVEWSFGLPAALRLNKLALKKIAATHLPSAIVARSKMGFPLPESFLSKHGVRLAEQEFVQRSFHELATYLMGRNESSLSPYNH